MYQQAKFCPHTAIHGWIITTSGLEKQTSAILEFYFRYYFRPFHRNRRVIVRQADEFGTNPRRQYDVISILQHGGRLRSLLLPVSYLLMSLPSEGQSLPANQILSTYLKSWLRYYYFRFGKTNVRHFGILLPVSISTSSS